MQKTQCLLNPMRLRLKSSTDAKHHIILKLVFWIYRLKNNHPFYCCLHWYVGWLAAHLQVVIPTLFPPSVCLSLSCLSMSWTACSTEKTSAATSQSDLLLRLCFCSFGFHLHCSTLGFFYPTAPASLWSTRHSVLCYCGLIWRRKS